MKRLKINIFLRRHRKLILFLVIIVFGGLTLLEFKKTNINLIIENHAVFGVVGTLLGAIVGGTFSLLGSVWVNSKQQKANQNIRRKNIIYSPLYDELMDIQNRILKLNPYPTYVLFEKGPQTMNPHPQFSAWRRIKADTRYLEVPAILIKKMEKLEKSIQKYRDIRGKANDEIQAILNEVLKENNLRQCNIMNIGAVISKDILSDNKVDIYNMAIEIDGEKRLDNQTREIINQQIYDMCNSSQIILNTRGLYLEWLENQKETLKMLGLLIEQVLIKYEG